MVGIGRMEGSRDGMRWDGRIMMAVERWVRGEGKGGQGERDEK